jgi:uncharacterized damage-inducible protein DinB
MADLESRKARAANHNDSDLGTLTESLREARAKLVAFLETLPAEAIARSSTHPRINEPMRLIDLMQFIADHDGHHLSRMTELMGPV